MADPGQGGGRQGGDDLGGSVDSKDDQELYMRLMAERRRLQRQQEEKKQRQKRTVKVRQPSAQRSSNLEERERGFQLFVSGANEARVDEARRRQQVHPAQQRRRSGAEPGARPGSGDAKEWQMETVELRGRDGAMHRCSPNHTSEGAALTGEGGEAEPCGSEVGEDIGDGTDAEGSRPSTGASTASGVVDRDTRNVLRLMNTANRDQLQHLRETLSGGGLERRSALGSGHGLPPRLSSSGRSASTRHLDQSRPSSGAPPDASRPSSSASSAIASAIMAENARVRRFTESGGLLGEEEGGSGSRPSSRPSSKAGRKLPLTPEVAAGCAPPSAIGGGSSASSRQLPVPPRLACELQAYPGGASPGNVAGYPEGGGRAPLARAASPLTRGAADASPSRGVAGELTDRVGRLDPRKQKALLRVLESLEDEVASSSPARSGVAPSASAPALSSPGGEVRLRVLSNWGDRRQCGLALVEALSSSGEALRLPPAALSLHGTQSGTTTLPRVVQGAGTSTSDKTMWAATTTPLASGAGFEPFELRLHISPAPAALRLWNYNGAEGLQKGARAVEIWCGAQLAWSGELPQGTGLEQVTPLIASWPSASQAGTSPGVFASDLPVHGDLDGGEREEVGDEPHEDREHGVGNNDLMQSLRALEQFRSSQSRRFFGQLNGGGDDLRATDGFLPSGGREQLGELQHHRWHTSDGWRPAGASVPEAAQGVAPIDTRAIEQDLLAQQEFIEGQDVPFEGMDIPVRGGFDDDAFDGFLDDRPSTVMGSSLMAGRFSPSESLVIPTLPKGRTLLFNCVSTWGDENFVGLAGIEIFDGRGFPVVMKDPLRQVSADPHSINVLPEYEHDPRTPDKLFDQVNLTRDDLHVWLAPFFAGRQAHTITVDLERTMSLSMIRVWNYNKSRLHSSRGVRDMEILLDGVPVFAGEIRRAPGVLASPEEACEHILFTQDEAVLSAVEEHDWLPEYLPVDDSEDLADTMNSTMGAALQKVSAPSAGSRPPTAGFQGRGGDDAPPMGTDGRPLTRASTERPRARGTLCGSLTLVIHSTWGDPHYVGLTAVELLNAGLEPMALEPGMVDASPRDLNDLEGVEDDPRTLDKLLDGVGCTTDDAHMWLAPFVKAPATTSGEAGMLGKTVDFAQRRNLIKIDFNGERREVAGFNMWNYNKNVEATSRGVREFSVFCDERYIATFLCRKAPGHVHFDFKQVVLLDQPPSADANVRRVGATPTVPRLPSRSRRDDSRRSSGDRSGSRDGRQPSAGERPRSRDGRAPSTSPPGTAGKSTGVQQQYETPLHPCGFIFRFVFLSSWSDAHYIGLDGIELLDIDGHPLRPKRVHSNYGSVRDMPGMENDVRTEDTFLRGAPGSSGRMWLAPLCRQPPNFVELVFNEPTGISCARFWNYSRTASRGVRDIEIYVDDLLIYQGILRQDTGAVRPSSRSSSPSRGGGRGHGGESVLFTSQPDVVDRERACVYLPSMEELVTFFDESGQVSQAARRPGLPVGERPGTALVT